jgi:hypothetical protein
MSKMAELHFSLVEEIVRGELSFRDIASKYGVPFSWVDTVASEIAAEDEAIYFAEAMGNR